jgi:hypothetical protein
LDNGSVTITRGLLGQIERRPENSERHALRPRQVRNIVSIPVQMGIDIIAARFVFSIIDPAEQGDIGPQRTERQNRTRSLRRLIGVRGRPTRRKG